MRVVDLIVHQYFLIHPIDYHAPRTGRPTDSHSTLRKSIIDSISVQLQVGNGMVSAAMLAINRASQGSGPPRTPHPLPQHQPRMLHPTIRTAAADPNRVPPRGPSSNTTRCGNHPRRPATSLPSSPATTSFTCCMSQKRRKEAAPPRPNQARAHVTVTITPSLTLLLRPPPPLWVVVPLPQDPPSPPRPVIIPMTRSHPPHLIHSHPSLSPHRELGPRSSPLPPRMTKPHPLHPPRS